MKTKLLARPLVSAVKSTLNLAHDKLFDYMQRTGLIACVAHPGIASYTDTLYYITSVLPGTYDAAGYAGSGQNWVLIDRVESFPEFGSDRPVAEFRPITGAVEKSKGAPNYGGGPMTMADMPLDAGQIILKAAEVSANHYSMKAAFPDGEVAYFDVLVTSWRNASAKEGSFAIRTAGIQFCKYPVSVAAP